MALATSLGSLLILVGLLAIDSASVNSEVSKFLEENGLPGGLLPSSVSDCKISGDGTFQVHLEKECYAKFENLVWYDEKISGKLSYGKIENLQGIQAKELFVWLQVTGIHIDAANKDYIIFDVGLISKKLAISEFESPPKCRKSGNYNALPAFVA